VRVLAAMSGGVDSAVAAARMVDAGHEVTGVHLALSRTLSASPGRSRGCCTREDARDARRVADRLGIPFYVWDLADRFSADVVDDFVTEYAAGRTPNPCLRCNERIKFAAVLDRAVALGFDAVCTGHYARLEPRPDGPPWLLRAVDRDKDQSYVLAVLTAHQLSRALFPLGGAVKRDVREEARNRGLAVADKRDSHDVCFIADGDTAGFLHRALGPAPGPIVDADTGSEVGTHDGAFAFTVGQRRGLRIAHPAADGRARYVVAVSPSTRTVTVGPRERLATSSLTTCAPRWCAPPPAPGARVLAQYRSRGDAVPVTLTHHAAAARVEFAEPQHGVAPGQTVAFYRADRVLGSATIDRVHPGEEA
jgi:tRNA-specific 2-thiouridylase